MSSLLTEEYKDYIVKNYADQTNKELLENLIKLGYKGGMTTIRNFRYANNLRKAKEGCFCKEYERTWWIGKTKDKYPELYVNSRGGYESGHIPYNKMPIGYVYEWKTDKHNRYKFIRTEDGIKQYHRYIWEQANGEIPEGYCIKFLDNNPLNCTLENLILCKKDIAIRGARIGFTDDKELNMKILKVAELKGAIKDVRDKNRPKHRRND